MGGGGGGGRHDFVREAAATSLILCSGYVGKLAKTRCHSNLRKGTTEVAQLAKIPT